MTKANHGAHSSTMPTVEAPPLERKLVAILAADVEGYSRLMHDDQEKTLATLSAHRNIIDALIAAGRGEISGTAGDSVLAEFASVVDAVHCAVSIQQALAKANADLPAGSRMLLRIGINVGDVMVKDGGIFGDGVNVAVRLEAIAEPGGICVTRGVRDHLATEWIMRGPRRTPRQEYCATGACLPRLFRSERNGGSGPNRANRVDRGRRSSGRCQRPVRRG